MAFPPFLCAASDSERRLPTDTSSVDGPIYALGEAAMLAK